MTQRTSSFDKMGIGEYVLIDLTTKIFNASVNDF